VLGLECDGAYNSLNNTLMKLWPNGDQHLPGLRAGMITAARPGEADIIIGRVDRSQRLARVKVTKQINAGILPPFAWNQSERRIRPTFRGSILDAHPPAQGVKIARRMTANWSAPLEPDRIRRQF
jgi:hypothetical protein